MNYLIVGFLAVTALNSSAFACNSDYDCGYGNRCVKAAGDYHYTGVCVVPTDQYGNRDYSANNNWGRSGQAREVDSCQFDTDCGIGGSCLKRTGSIFGICTK